MNILLHLFLTFFKIGLFTFGGGYAMIPMIKEEVISNGWIAMSDLVDFIAVSESTPGPFAVNIATFIGMNMSGLPGAFFATLGVVLPSFIIILVIARFFAGFKDNFYVKSALYGLRPIVIGLIASATFSIALTGFFPSFSKGMSLEGFLSSANVLGMVIFLVLFLINHKKKLHPIALIILSALMGILFFGIAGMI